MMAIQFDSAATRSEILINGTGVPPLGALPPPPFPDSAGPSGTVAASSAGDGTFYEGETITFIVDFDETTFIHGEAALDLTGGRTAALASSIDEDTLTFTYTVQQGDSEDDLEVLGLSNFGENITDLCFNTAYVSATQNLDIVLKTDPYADFDRGTEGRDYLFGDFFHPDKIFGAGGNDKIFGGLRDDHLAGGEGKDKLFGRWGNDRLDGNEGKDWLNGGFGHDELHGGPGRDQMWGGRGRDTFVYAEGDGYDTIHDFQTRGWFGSDGLAFDVEGVSSAADALAYASQWGRHVIFDFGDGDMLRLNHTQLRTLTEDHIDIL